MKILRVIGSMNPSSGGPCQGIRNSIPELEKKGVHNEVLCFDDPLASFIGNDTFQVYALGPRKDPWNYNAKLIPWLIENFARFNVVIVHGLWLYQSYAVSKALQQYKQKQLNSSAPLLFVMPHGMLDPYFQKASSRKLKAIRNWMYWKLIEAKVVNEADGILFTCKAELELARKSFRPYHPKRKINVGYGILAPPLFKPSMKKAFYENCPDLDQQPFILFLSRIHKKKGIDLLLKAYALLVQKIEKLNKQVESNKNSSKGKAITGSNNRQVPKLVIAGPGLDTHYGVKLQQTVATSKELKETVHFLGMLSGEAKWGAFYACEAFVLPSHQENFGIAVVEALACAKPVLISNQVNIWREIEAAECGLVADDTLKGTVQLLEGWFNLEQEDKGTMSKKALITYEKQFAISTAVESFLNAINLCIEDNNIG